MAASEVVAKMSLKGDKSTATYAQAIALADLAEEAREEAIQEAAKEAGGQAPTGKQVKKAAERVLGKKSTAKTSKAADEEKAPIDTEDEEYYEEPAPVQAEDERPEPDKPNIPIATILEWVDELWGEVEPLEGSEDACELIGQIMRALRKHVSDVEYEEVAA